MRGERVTESDVRSEKCQRKVESLSHKHRHRYAYLKEEKKYIKGFIAAKTKLLGCRLL